MALSQAKICNLALAHVGIKQMIDAITDDNREAAQCNLHWEMAISAALEQFDWGFARRRIDLVTYAGDPNVPWSYQYEYPDDCVRPIRIDDEQTWRHNPERIPFVTETNASGDRVLYCNVEDAVLVYTYLEANYDIWTHRFAEYMAWELAARIAYPLTSSEKIQKACETGAVIAMRRAIGRSIASEQQEPYTKSEIEASRA